LTQSGISTGREGDRWGDSLSGSWPAQFQYDWAKIFDIAINYVMPVYEYLVIWGHFTPPPVERVKPGKKKKLVPAAAE
jgi:hypothetical protein